MSTPTAMRNRELLKQVYPYKTWWAKVDKMTDAQVTALFLKFRSQGKV